MTSKKWIDGVNAIGIISKAGKYNGSNPSDEGFGGGYAEINRRIRRRMRCKMKFSEKVKYARMKLLLTQEALAKELGVSYATICRWEKENREPQIVSQGKFYAFCESKGIKFEE